jgi:hypothetical protein
MNLHDYHLDECVLPLPVGFRDASVQVFEWTLDDGEQLSLLIQREPRTEGRMLEDSVRTVTRSYPQKFMAYHEEEPMVLGTDLRCVSKRFRWRHESGVLYHHQLFLELDSCVMLLTASCKATHRDEADVLLLRALEGMQLRESA